MGYFAKYDTPADLLADKDLSTGEKIELLVDVLPIFSSKLSESFPAL